MYTSISNLTRCPYDSNTRFAPENCLRDLFTESKPALRDILKERLPESNADRIDRPVDVLVKRLPEPNADRIGKLVDFICERAPKAFATLVCCRGEQLIVQFFANDFDDNLLPVEINRVREIKSFLAAAAAGTAAMAAKTASEYAAKIKVVDAKTEAARRKPLPLQRMPPPKPPKPTNGLATLL